MGDNKTNSSKKIIIALIAVIVLLVVGIALFFVFNKKDDNKEQESTQSDIIGYESNVITDDPEKLQDVLNDMYKKAEEGQMGLSMKSRAISDDGQTFSCYLGNATNNSYDMYMILYRDDTQEEIYRSGLIPVGSRIESFTINNRMETGEYQATLVYNQVEDDKQTVHAQVVVGLTLVVN